MHRSQFATVLVVSCLASCASIVSKSSWPVHVSATPENAEVEIVDQSGQVVHKARAPFTVTLKSGAGYFDGETYSFRGSAPGWGAGVASADTQMNGWFFGNILLGGVIGMLIVDPATGAMWKLPEHVHVTLVETKP